MISASCGSAGRVSPLPSWSCVVASDIFPPPRSEPLDEADPEAPARELGLPEPKAGRRKANAAFEATVGNLQPTDRGAASFRRQPSQPRHAQHVAVDRDIEILWLDAGKRGNDPKLAFGFEDVDGRLPTPCRRGRDAGLKELPMQPFGPLDQRAGLAPQEISRVARGHGTRSEERRVGK